MSLTQIRDVKKIDVMCDDMTAFETKLKSCKRDASNDTFKYFRCLQTHKSDLKANKKNSDIQCF
jgi:hypothetical protein